MKKVEEMEYFPMVDKVAEILMTKTRSSDPLFFRVMVSYYLAKVASMMRATVKTVDRGNIPISLYALNLAPSGHGKNFSTNQMTDHNTYDRVFGSMTKALRLAGVPQRPNGRNLRHWSEARSKKLYLKMLQEFEKLHDRKPSKSDCRRGLLPSESVYKFHFGSWKKALKEAGV